MPRIIVTTDTAAGGGRPGFPGAVLLDEQVQSVHLSTGHAATQLVERLAWAIVDAEEREGGRSEPPPGLARRRLARVPARGTRARKRVAAR